MNWFAFILFAGFLLTVQSAVAPHLSIAGARPDFLLVAAVYLGLFGRPREAMAGAWLIGVGGDLLTAERFGLLALSYLLITLPVSAIRLHVFRENGLTQVVVTLAAFWMIGLCWLIYRHVLYDPAETVVAGLAVSVALSGIYTAMMAPPLLWLFRRLAPALGMPRRREATLAFS